MRIGCPHCGHQLSYSDAAPRFCSNCGRPMIAAPAVGLETATTPGPDPFATLAAVPGTDTHGDKPLVLGGYRLLRFVGGGGMGSVHEAEEEATGRRVALKVIRAEFSDSPDALDRFRREGRLAATIQHPRCVFVLGADEEAGRPYIVMELMPGQNLQDRVEAAGPLPIGEAVRHILDTIEGLEEAHRCGVVHRDVKPSNCFLDADGRVKVGDFGLAKSLIGEQALTRSGAFLGTLLFASPEQIRNDHVDHSTDIYSACATLYFLLTGKAPFQDGDAASTLARTVTEPAPSMRKLRPELPHTLDEVVLRGLERSRKKRWRSLDELRLALLPFVEPEQCIAGLGWRVCAYLIDRVGRTPLDLLAGLTLAMVGPSWVAALSDDGPTRMAVAFVGSLLLSLACSLLYFAVPEALWGWSPGKYLMRLRVREAATGDRPRWWRSALRTLSFYIVKDAVALMAGIVLLAVVSRLAQVGEQDVAARVTRVGLLLGAAPALSGLFGLLILASTMRRRSGLRALHEWMSGTWLIRLPEARPRFRAGAATWPKESPLPEGVPRRLGGLRVCAVAGEGGGGRVCHAEEETLGRPVWLWLRDGGSAPSRERREAARPGRARWLAGGTADDRRWDAFIAAPGQPLPAVVSPRAPLGWRETLAILEQLTEELLAASRDGTLPPRAGPHQVWLVASGQVVLLDAPLAGEAVVESPLDLLRQAAATALEGKPRAPDDLRRPIQAPVPRAASYFLGRLVEEDSSLEQVCLAIQEVREEPAEVPRPARALQVAANAALAVPGLAWMFTLGPGLLLLAFLASFYAHAKLEFAIAENEAAGASAELDLALLPGVADKLTAAGRYTDGRAENRALWSRLRETQLERDNLLGGWDWLLSDTFAQTEEEMREGFFGTNDLVDRRDLDKRRRELEEMDEVDELFADGASGLARSWLDEWAFPLLVLAAWPLLWATWAGLTRGGVVPRVMGVALVDRRGRPAPRWRCSLRELFVWLPVVVPLTGSLFLDLLRLAGGTGWDQDWLAFAGWAAFGLWWLALLLLPVMAFRAVRGPRRALPDRLAGLFLVPG